MTFQTVRLGLASTASVACVLRTLSIPLAFAGSPAMAISATTMRAPLAARAWASVYNQI